jgi:2-polyprenyl-6-hydroxyphenyl methylase/3-demethylubiquinone-9 3-methyltransferase
MAQNTLEVSSGDRFDFGRNWTRFLGALNEERIARAQESLSEWLEAGTLQNRTFLDVGSGSGAPGVAAGGR